MALSMLHCETNAPLEPWARVTPLVLVSSSLGTKFDRKLPLVTIEPTSATWRAIHPLLRERHPELLAGELVFVESFGAAVQMLRAGFGNGLVPLGLAMDMKVKRKSLRALPGIVRRICLLTRKSMHQESAFIGFRDRLSAAARRHFSGEP